MSKKITDLLLKYLMRLIAWFTASTEAWIKRSIKTAGVALTTPATVKVASQLYPDDPMLSFIVTVAAVILVEGTLLLGWHKLDDTSVPSTNAQRWLYTGLAGTSYVVTWAVALAHGEGVVGIFFRLTLLAALVYSVYNSGILATIRLQRSAARDITHHRKVRKYREQSDIRIARLEVDAREITETQRIMPGYVRKVPGIAGLIRVFAPDIQSRAVKPLLLPASLPEPDFAPTPLDRELLVIYAANPAMHTRDAGALVGKSHTTVNNRLNAMQRGGVIHRNGNGVEILQPDLVNP